MKRSSGLSHAVPWSVGGGVATSVARVTRRVALPLNGSAARVAAGAAAAYRRYDSRTELVDPTGLVLLAAADRAMVDLLRYPTGRPVGAGRVLVAPSRQRW